jgi:hypothetical protein
MQPIGKHARISHSLAPRLDSVFTNKYPMIGKASGKIMRTTRIVRRVQAPQQHAMIRTDMQRIDLPLGASPCPAMTVLIGLDADRAELQR